MAQKNEIERFWDLINHFESYLETGIAKEHESFIFAKVENDQERQLQEIHHSSDYERHFEEYKTLSVSEKILEWRQTNHSIAQCSLCTLCENRKNPLKSNESQRFDLLVIGDYPSEEEDSIGAVAVGKEGDYLKKWLESIQLTLGQNVAYTTVLKCRPSDTQRIAHAAIDACRGYLEHQIAVSSPKAILATGELFLRYFLNSQEGIFQVVGNLYQYHGYPVIPCFAPERVLQQSDLRRPVWEALKTLQRLLANR